MDNILIPELSIFMQSLKLLKYADLVFSIQPIHPKTSLTIDSLDKAELSSNKFKLVVKTKGGLTITKNNINLSSLLNIIKNQTYDNIIEWVIIDCCNNNYVNNLTSDKFKINYILYTENQKNGTLRNLANSLAHGDIIIWMEENDFYFNNKENLVRMQETFFTGTDQPVLNFMCQIENVKMKFLPYEFNMVDMPRKEILTEDLLFTKIGYIYQYNCIPNNQDNKATYYWMKKTYEHLYEN